MAELGERALQPRLHGPRGKGDTRGPGPGPTTAGVDPRVDPQSGRSPHPIRPSPPGAWPQPPLQRPRPGPERPADTGGTCPQARERPRKVAGLLHPLRPWARLCPAYTGLWSPNRDQRTTLPLRANVSAIAGVYPGRRTCHNTPPYPQATPSEVLGDGGCLGKLTRWLWGT